LYDNSELNGKEFIRKVRRLARKSGVLVHLDRFQGKGSHQTLYYGNRRTTVKSGEIGIGLLNAMCKQLGIRPEDLR